MGKGESALAERVRRAREVVAAVAAPGDATATDHGDRRAAITRRGGRRGQGDDDGPADRSSFAFSSSSHPIPATTTTNTIVVIVRRPPLTTTRQRRSMRISICQLRSIKGCDTIDDSVEAEAREGGSVAGLPVVGGCAIEEGGRDGNQRPAANA